jgi:DNA-binding response OmpR family regulator
MSLQPTIILGQQYFRILCVDESVTVLRMLEQVLRESGYTVEIESNAAEVPARLTNRLQPFDLLIADVSTQRFDGQQLIVDARAAGYRGKIIVFSGCIIPEDREKLLDLGIDALVAKPASIEELLGVVKAIQTAVYALEHSLE